MINFESWTIGTANLSWGAQAAMHDALTLAAEGKIELVHGADYMDGKPCLVNSVGQMLEAGGGKGIPSANFGNVVMAFDRINRALQEQKVNTKENFVSPLAAEILLANFGPLKGAPEAPQEPVNLDDESIIAERSDEEFATSWLEAIKSDAPVADWDAPGNPMVDLKSAMALVDNQDNPVTAPDADH